MFQDPTQTPLALPDTSLQNASESLLICDLTQSWSPTGGGGVSTYLKEKQKFVRDKTQHRLVQIVPGPQDRISVDGRITFIEVGAPEVWGSPHYRWINRNDAVFELLKQHQPDIIESQCPWVLPWLAIRHRRAFPQTALVAGYHTDFPNAQIYRVMRDLVGHYPAALLRNIGYFYAWMTYHRFDRVYTLNQQSKQVLARLGYHRTGLLGLGVDIDRFSPAHADPHYRASVGLPQSAGPLLIYVGRLDNEKGAPLLIEMFKHLPRDLGAQMVLIGDGKMRAPMMEAAAGLPIAFPGFETDRSAIARALASSDIYVSGMADETFGISVLEAQASGLPVVGIASGAMPERVPSGAGLLVPPGNAKEMALGVARVWRESYAEMQANALLQVGTSNRWEATFEQLFAEEYPEALKARDVRTKDKLTMWRGPSPRFS